MKHSYLGYVIALVCTLPAHVFAADKNEKIYDTMIVTVAPVSSPLTVVTNPKQPQQPIPASDGADYLKTIAGFSVVRKGGTNGDPVFRGMFGSRLNILANGSSILGGCGGRMDTPTAYISPETYDRITVIKGPETVVWGPMGSAATVLFERDPLRFTEADGFARGNISYGSADRFDQSFDGAVGNEYGYLRLLANRARASDYYDGNGDRVHSKWERWNGDIALGVTPNADTLIEITAGKGNGEARYADRAVDGARFKRESFGLRYEQSNIGEVLNKIEGQLYYNYIDHLMNNYSLRSVTGKKSSSNPDRKTLGGRFNTTWLWDYAKLQFGVDGRQDTHRSRLRRNMLATGKWKKDSFITNYGVFSELNIYLTDLDTLISGVRIDHYFAKAYQLDQERNENLPGGFIRYEHEFAELATTFYSGLGYTSRFPDYWELFSSGNKKTMFKQLEPEKTTQLDVGLLYKGDGLNVWLSGYTNWVNDYIIYTTRSKANNVNNVDARTMGAEFGGSFNFTAHLVADIALSYTWAKNRDNGKPLPQIPPLELRLGLNYKGENWSVGGLWRLVDSQNRIAKDQGNVIGKDFANSSGFGILSLNGEYTINKNFRLTAGVDNLFDKYYVEHLNRGGVATFGYTANQQIAEQGRVFWAKLNYDF